MTSKRIHRTLRERAFLDRETTIESGADSGNHMVLHTEILEIIRYSTERKQPCKYRWRRHSGPEEMPHRT
jgi:hypothetical protein